MNSKYNSIIFFTRYDKQSASVRYRYIQYFNDLKESGINVELSYLFDEKFFKNKILLNKINFLLILISYIKRFLKIIFLNKKTIIVIHLELFPYLPSIGEKLLSFKKNRIIIDLDDAIFHQYTDLNSKFLNYFLSNNHDMSWVIPFKVSHEVSLYTKRITQKRYFRKIMLLKLFNNISLLGGEGGRIIPQLDHFH